MIGTEFCSHAVLTSSLENRHVVACNSSLPIAVLIFDGFNELDSLIVLGVLNRIKRADWRITLCCPTPTVSSVIGVTVHAQSTLGAAATALHYVAPVDEKDNYVASHEKYFAVLVLVDNRSGVRRMAIMCP